MIIDRFEGDLVVVEYAVGKTFILPRVLLPPEAKEGDVLDMVVTINDERTEGLREDVKRLVDDLFE